MVKSCDLFFNQEFPHTDRIVRLHCHGEGAMTCHSTVPTWCVELGHGGEWKPAGRSADLLFHSQAQIHDEPNPSGQKMQSA